MKTEIFFAIGEACDVALLPTRFIPCLRFKKKIEVEINSCTLIPLFMLGSVHSDSASWDDCGRLFPDTLRVCSFLDRLPHYAWKAA